VSSEPDDRDMAALVSLVLFVVFLYGMCGQ
jgi:hypothetical protein